MALYEHIFLARQDISTQQVETLIEQFKGVLSDNGGTVGKVENWGLRTTAYRIRKKRKAHFVMMNVDAPHEALSEMERQMRINDDVLRYLTIRVEELDEEPSAMMKKNDRDDRPRRDGPRFGQKDGPKDGPREERPRTQASSETATKSDDVTSDKTEEKSTEDASAKDTSAADTGTKDKSEAGE